MNAALHSQNEWSQIYKYQWRGWKFQTKMTTHLSANISGLAENFKPQMAGLHNCFTIKFSLETKSYMIQFICYIKQWHTECQMCHTLPLFTKSWHTECQVSIPTCTIKRTGITNGCFLVLSSITLICLWVWWQGDNKMQMYTTVLPKLDQHMMHWYH